MTAELPTVGRIIVDTLTDAYDVDLDARIAIKTGLDVDADQGVGEPDAFLFDTVEIAEGFLLFDVDTYPLSSGYVIGVTTFAAVTA